MIGYVRGELADIEENKVIVEAGNIGYNILVPADVTSRLPGIGEEIKLFTYLSVKEDAMQLFGFRSKDDLQVFKLLIGVNGVGPKAGLGILSTLSSDDLRFAVLSDDAKKISEAPGIGKKTAQKLILELKDKFSLEDSFEQKLVNHQGADLEAGNDARKEAVLALESLGYSKGDAAAAVRKIDITEDMTVEEILKQAFVHLSI